MRLTLLIALMALAVGCSSETETQAPPDTEQARQEAPPATASAQEPEAPEPDSDPFALTDDELAMDAPAEALSEQADESAPAGPVKLEDAGGVELQVFAETGYENEKGEQMIDLLEQDYAYLTVQLMSDDGRPIVGAKPELSVTGSSRIVPLTELASGEVTNAQGMFDFAVVGGNMGLDRVKVAVRDSSVDVLLNVISLKAAGFANPEAIEGSLSWGELTKARV